MKESAVEISDDDLRQKQVEKIVNFIQKVGAYEYFQSLLSKPDGAQEVSFDQFMGFIIRINGIARDIPISERKTDGRGVYLSGYDEAQVPNHDDKEKILKEVFDVIDKVKREELPFLIPAAVNAVHLFADGNGRTSRVLHLLLTKFDNFEDFLRGLESAVGIDGRYETRDINPGIVRVDIEKIILIRHGFQFENNSDWSPILPEGFAGLFDADKNVNSKNAQHFLGLIRADHSECFISARDFLQDRGILIENVIKRKGGQKLSLEKMDKNLTDADWEEIFTRYYALKKEHVEVLMESFVNPDAYKCLDGSMNLKDYFIKEIQERFDKNNENK